MTFYILNVALVLTGCLLFYKVLLQKETFFPLNRFILLGCLALSFSLPLVPAPEGWSLRKKEAADLVIYSPLSPQTQAKLPTAAAPVVQQQESAPVLDGIALTDALIWLYWSGVIIFALNFLIQILTLIYRAYSRPVIRDGRFRIVELSGDKAPCSFGNNIFINPEKYDWDTYNQILLHEKIHIEQGHSFDILLAELALIFQWFNPFAWMYRKAVEDNLEFLTDNELLSHNEVPVESYQMSLVKVSAPHFPVSLTTNYNQSILKKRLIMMTAKKSNIHTAWKYFFIVPLMIAFVCLLNEPMAYGKGNTAKKGLVDFQNTGYWFATIKNDKVNIQFKNDEDEKNQNSNTTFELREFNNLPKTETGTFSLVRDAGTMNFTGKFDGNMGMGKYEYKSNTSFMEYLESKGIETEEDEQVAYFLLNVKRSFVEMLGREGYKNFDGGNLIALTALGVDESFIKIFKDNGFKNVSLEQLIPLKAVGVDEKYLKEMRAAYPNVSHDQLITLKAQNLSAAALKDSMSALKTSKEAMKETMKALRDIDVNDKGDKGSKGPKGDKGDNKRSKEDKAFDNMIATKVLGITKEYMDSFKEVGLTLNEEGAIAMKSLGVTVEYIKSIRAAGIEVNDEAIAAMKALGVTPEYIKSIKATGLKMDTEDIAAMKSLGVTAEDIKSYQALKFSSLDMDDIISAKATGVTPVYINEMRKKGHNFNSIEKYVTMKSLSFIGVQ